MKTILLIMLALGTTTVARAEAVIGSVTRQADGYAYPLPHSQVLLCGTEPTIGCYSAFTSLGGTFQFEDVAPGEYQLRFMTPGGGDELKGQIRIAPERLNEFQVIAP